MPRDPEAWAHQEWLGYVQPVGLVVSTPALAAAQAHVNKNIAADHQRFLAALPRTDDDEPIPEIRDFAEFVQTVLGWRDTDLEAISPGDPKYASLEVVLPEYHETLSPTHLVREQEPKDASRPWMMLVKVLPAGAALDEVATDDDRHWQATPHAKFERLLRETQVPLGLLVNGSHIRLVYAPRGESSGYATFGVAEMMQVAGRPIFAALHMLLCEERLFSLGEKQRLPAILAESRKYQNVVSTKLAEQVLAALYELLRGFQAADEQTRGELLRQVLAEDPNHVYGGLLTVLMRLVFVLYAEDRGLVSTDPVYSNHYSVTGLYERLRADNGRFPDTMDQRYGGWAQLLTLFRLIHEGGSHRSLRIPAREGYLFDPDRYNFLEGRPWKTARRHHDGDVHIPRVSDGVLFRVLDSLLMLDGERLSYRTLDVEQIGSVYETMMGFDLEVAQGRSISIKPKKPHGAPTTINLDALLAEKPGDRNKWLKAQSDQEVTGQAATALKEAKTVEDLLAALDRRIHKGATPGVVARGAMILQPSDERRRSGSHYTPRSLTEPIVRTTLEPVLKQLGEHPTPEQILSLKVCDPAMGSGAFLVEACRQLGDCLVNSWHVHAALPSLPPDEDEVLHARRLVAQRCLYGVDRNPMAVDLSKLSLWLATLAKDHPFTFLDHSLRCGDSLVGLTRDQIAAFHWQPAAQRDFLSKEIRARIDRATEYRRKILAARDDVPYAELRQCLELADDALSIVRLVGDAAVAAFFEGDNAKSRERARVELAEHVETYLSPKSRIEDREPIAATVRELRSGSHPVAPFHWTIEFPEVFGGSSELGSGSLGKASGKSAPPPKSQLPSPSAPGFDAIVGNPPFMGGTKLSSAAGAAHMDWLATTFVESRGKSDLVAYFFRRAFELVRNAGTFGLIATNSIGQGDTRFTGLRWIRTQGGRIYFAERRKRWPGVAAVVVSVVNVIKSVTSRERTLLDGHPTEKITAYLFHIGPDENPHTLLENTPLVHSGTNINGKGFVLDEHERAALIAADTRSEAHIRPYLGAEEMNESSDCAHSRYVIYLEGKTKEEVQSLSAIYTHLSGTVRIQRQGSSESRLREQWWTYSRPARELYDAARGMSRVLASARHWSNLALSYQPTTTIFSDSLTLFLLETYSTFAAVQCRVHEVWARFMGSSLKDDCRYIPEDCFETFPFPPHIFEHVGTVGSPRPSSDSLFHLECAGREYYDFRAALMVRNDEGLTKTYNRFHDPHERSPDILKLRELHAAMDRTVLEAYGWRDLAAKATCEFLLDYEDDEDDEEELTGRRTRKKPWRYRWPDDFRDEVLARLLDLNQKRAEEERRAAEAARELGMGSGESGKKKAKGATKKPRKKAASPDQTELFG